MTLLGVQLTTPDRPRLFRLLSIFLIGLVITGILQLFGLPIEYVRAVGIGIVSGALASAYGVEMPRHGWRGAVIALLFWLGLMIILVAAGIVWDTV